MVTQAQVAQYEQYYAGNRYYVPSTGTYETAATIANLPTPEGTAAINADVRQQIESGAAASVSEAVQNIQSGRNFATGEQRRQMGVPAAMGGEQYFEKTIRGITYKIPSSIWTPNMTAQAAERRDIFGTRSSGYGTYNAAAPSPTTGMSYPVVIPAEQPQQPKIPAQKSLQIEGMGQYNPFTKTYTPMGAYDPARKRLQQEGVSIAPSTALKLGIITKEQATQEMAEGGSYAVYASDLNKAQAAYKDEQKIQQRMAALKSISKKDRPMYLGLYYTSAWGSGPVSAAYIGAKSIGQPIESWIKGEPLSSAAGRELREFAIRTLNFEKEPTKTVGFGMLQAPLVAGGSFVLGSLGAKAALYSDVAGSAFNIGTKLLFGGAAVADIAPSLIKGEYAESVGKFGEILSTAGLGYEPFKIGVRKQLEVAYIEKYGISKEALSLAAKAGNLANIKVRPYKDVLNEMPIMGKGSTRLKSTTLDLLISQKENIIIGGSSAARTQIEGKIPKDIDIYAGDVGEFKNVALSAYRKAGLDVTSKGSGLMFKGQKLFDIHTTEFLTQKTFYMGEVLSPEGLKLMNVRGQLFRKVSAIYEEPSKIGRRKDIPDFEKMVNSVITTGQLEAESSLPIFKQFKQAKISSTKKALDAFIKSSKGYASTTTYDVKTPLLISGAPLSLLSYKNTENTRKIPIQYTTSNVFKDYGPLAITPSATTYTPPRAPSNYGPTSITPITYTPTGKAPTYGPTLNIPKITGTTYKPPSKENYPKYTPPTYRQPTTSSISSDNLLYPKRKVSSRRSVSLGFKTGRPVPIADLLSITSTQSALLALGKRPLALNIRSKRTRWREFRRTAGLRVRTAQMYGARKLALRTSRTARSDNLFAGLKSGRKARRSKWF